VITALSPKAKFTAAYFCSDIIPKIAEQMPFDNDTPHLAWESITCLKKFRIRPIDYPPSSPDLAPSDFYLFGKLKGALAGQECESTEELLLMIRGVTDSTGPGDLEPVFDAWERRPNECIQTKGEYIASDNS
jgi:hypothetical protein